MEEKGVFFVVKLKQTNHIKTEPRGHFSTRHSLEAEKRFWSFALYIEGNINSFQLATQEGAG